MKPPVTISLQDIERVRALVEARRDDAFMHERRTTNVDGPAPSFDHEEFWRILIGCLLTTQQRSTKGSPVDRFTEQKPFQLSLQKCSNDTEATVRSVLTAFRGIRMAPTIARRTHDNYQHLRNGGWASVESHFQKLALQRNRSPQIEDTKTERVASYYAAATFAGIGPKQSRNLWQWLGLTRYEIPLDSRICNWINNNLSAKVDVVKLGDSGYYDAALDYVQAICNKADVLPCIFDAGAFDYEEKGNTTELTMAHDSKGTTKTGYVNPNGQVVIRDTGVEGTDKFQRIYQLACSKCGNIYGANGSDCHLRLCPKCQGGAEGLPVKVGAHA